MKEEKTPPRPWEARDPKPPVIQSGHMESRVRQSKTQPRGDFDALREI